MIKQEVKDYKVPINNPSQLVLEVEELMQLRKKLPSQHESLKVREESIFNRLGERTIDTFYGILMFEMDMNHICEKVNEQYADGISLEEDSITYPYSRSIRRKPSFLEEPTKTQELATKKGIAIHVGKHQLIGNNNLVISYLSMPVVSQEETYEETHKSR